MDINFLLVDLCQANVAKMENSMAFTSTELNSLKKKQKSLRMHYSPSRRRLTANK